MLPDNGVCPNRAELRLPLGNGLPALTLAPLLVDGDGVTSRVPIRVSSASCAMDLGGGSPGTVEGINGIPTRLEVLPPAGAAALLRDDDDEDEERPLAEEALSRPPLEATTLPLL